MTHFDVVYKRTTLEHDIAVNDTVNKLDVLEFGDVIFALGIFAVGKKTLNILGSE